MNEDSQERHQSSLNTHSKLTRSDVVHRRQQSLGQRGGSVQKPSRDLKLSLITSVVNTRSRIHHQSMSSDSQRHQIGLSTDQSGRNFNSAKARMNNPLTMSSDGGMEPVYIRDEDVPKEKAAHLQRIKNAVSKPKDIFGEVTQTPIRMANYTLGKNERHKNPSRTRTTPNLPKAASKTQSSASLVTKPPKSTKNDSQQRLLQVQSATYSKMKPPQKPIIILPKKVQATPIQKAFSNLKKQTELPSAFKPMAGSRSTPNLTNESQSKDATVLLPMISNNTSNADLEVHIQPTDLPKQDTSGKQTAPTKASKQMRKKSGARQGSHSQSRSRSRSRSRRHPSGTDTLENSDIAQTIDMEFFKKNKVKQFNDVHHVEKVLDNAFPSAKKEEKELEKMAKSQTFLYEAYLDVDANPETENKDQGEDNPLRQATFGHGFEGRLTESSKMTPPIYETPLPHLMQHDRAFESRQTQQVHMNTNESLTPWDTTNQKSKTEQKADEKQTNFAEMVKTMSGQKPPSQVTISVQKPAKHTPFRLKDRQTSSPSLQIRHLTPSSLHANTQSSFNLTTTSLAHQLFPKQQTSETNPNIMTDELIQAFLTEESSELPLIKTPSQLVQAQKLAHLLNSRSSSVPRSSLQQTPTSKNTFMSKELKESTAQALGKSGQIAPKEFLQRIDSDIRKLSMEKMESLKQTHKSGFDQLEKCGILDSQDQLQQEQESKQKTVAPVGKRISRSNSQFAQHVREMNFFSVFVNTSVDEKIETQKLGTEESTSLIAASPENLNRDNKEQSLVSFEKSTLSIPTPIQPENVPVAPKNDQKDEKVQSTPTSTCQCHSLTNDMIRKLVLDSPIKDLVEQVHQYQQFHQLASGPGPGPTSQKRQSAETAKHLDPLRKALETQAQQNGNHTVNERTDVSVLNILLNQILTGKYQYDKTKVDDFAKINMNGKLDRFLGGIDFKGMLQEVQQTILKKQEGVLEKVDESEEEDGHLNDFFLLRNIKEKEALLEELLETRKIPSTKKFVPGEAATFLTQVYKETDHTQKEMSDKFPKWDKARNIMSISKEIINEHAASHECVGNQRKISNAKLKREQEVKSLFEQIHGITQEVQQTSVNFFQDQTTMPKDSQASNAGKEQLLYLCFLEIVRQVSGQCKEQALFLVKLWHAYFDHSQVHMKRTLQKAGEQTNVISQLLEQMTHKFAKVLVIDESKDIEFLALIDKHDKALQLLELVSKNLYLEREHTKQLQLELETLKDNFSDILPNYEKYYQNQDLRSRLMRYSVYENTDMWDQSERQSLHLTPLIRKTMAEQMERDPFQARIIQDLYRIQGVCTMRMPVDYALENAKEAFQKSSIALKMKEIYHKNLQEKAQRLKRQNEELIKRLQNLKEQHDIELIQKEFESKERITKAVKQFRQEQLQSILNEPKEVQTDHELIEKYFTDLENQREMGIRAMMVHRRLTNIQMQQIKVMKAFEKQPKFKHLTKPIVHIMRLVRDNKSDYPAKTLKKTLEIIAEVIEERLKLFNEPTNNLKVDYLNLEHFYAKFMSNRYGIDQLAQKYTEQWLVSVKAHSNRDYRVSLFMRFLGLGGYHSLPFSVFTFYLHLIKATNVEVDYIFKKEYDKEDTISISYQKAMFGYKDLIAKTNIFNRRNIMMQMRHASKIVASNPVILRELSFSMFETYRYLVEKVLKSQKYRSFSELLNSLFEEHSQYMENEKRKKKSPSKKKKLKRGYTTQLARTKTEDSLDHFSAIKEKSEEKDVNFDTPEKRKPEITVVDEVNQANNYLDSEAKATVNPVKVGEDLLSKQAIRAVDALEDEKDYVKLDTMVKFFISELSMTRPSDEQRVYDLLNVILISAQGARRDRIIRNQALRCFTEKIEIQISLDHFFHIGINAQIDHENSENMWLEKVFNFYSQLKTDNYKAVSGMDPDHKLVFAGEHTYDGLEFVQFYIFVKDGGSKYRKDQVTIFQIYEDECNQKNRQRLSCDDFIELVRKFNLIKSKGYFENNMRLRYEQAKGRTVHVDALNKSTQIARDDELYQQLSSSVVSAEKGSKRSKSKPVKAKQLDTSVNTTTPTKIRFKDLTDLQSVENTSREERKSSQNQSRNRKQVGRRSSFDQQFEDSKVPFKTAGQSGSMLNVITPMSMAGQTQTQQTLPENNQQTIKTLESNITLTKVDDTAAQQYVLLSKEDGSLEMSPEPNTNPTMLDDVATKSYQSNFVKEPLTNQVSKSQPVTQDQSKQIESSELENFTDTAQELPQPGDRHDRVEIEVQTEEVSKGNFEQRPPSPIMQTEQSRIIDQDVQDTINKINMQLNKPVQSYEQMRRKASKEHDDREESQDEFAEEVIIESAVQNLKFREVKGLKKKESNIVLSRQETLKAHAIENVNLIGYNMQSSDNTSALQEDKDLPAMHHQESQDDEELGYLDLMFGTGPNNDKLKEMKEEAKFYVEQEMKQQNHHKRSKSTSVDPLLEEISQQKSANKFSQPRVTEANSQSEFSASLLSEEDGLKIQIVDESAHDAHDFEPATAGLPTDKNSLKLNYASTVNKHGGASSGAAKIKEAANEMFHRGMTSGISEWNKGINTEVSIADKSIVPSKNSTDNKTDKSLSRSQTMNYMAMESRRSSKKTDVDAKSAKRPKKMVKKKKKKMVKMTTSPLKQSNLSQNEDISGLYNAAETTPGGGNQNNEDLSMVELDHMIDKEQSSESAQGPATSGKKQRISFNENRSLDGKSSPAMNLSRSDRKHLSSRHQSVKDILQSSTSLYEPTSLSGNSPTGAGLQETELQRITPGFALANNQFGQAAQNAVNTSPSPSPDKSQELHPSGFNYGNTTPPEPEKSPEQIQTEKQRKAEIRMLERQAMQQHMKSNQAGFFTNHTYDDDDDFYTRDP